MLRTIVAGPVVEQIVAARDRFRSSSTAGDRLYGFGRPVDAALARAVTCDSIANGYVGLFPDCKQVFKIGSVVCRNLNSLSSFNSSILFIRSVPNKEICSFTTFGLCPSLEGKACTFRNRFIATQTIDIYTLVDLDRVIRAVNYTFSFIIIGVVIVPNDISWIFHLNIFVYCLELNHISIVDIFLYAIVGNDLASSICNPCIIHKHLEILTREDRIRLRLAVETIFGPGLQFPVVKHLFFRFFRGCCYLCCRESVVKIICSICRYTVRYAIIGHIVSHCNAVCTYNQLAPTAIKIQFFSDPSTIFFLILIECCT